MNKKMKITIMILISVHTNRQYQSVYSKKFCRLPVELDLTRMDYGWLSMCLSFISWKKRSESDSNYIVSWIAILLHLKW